MTADSATADSAAADSAAADSAATDSATADRRNSHATAALYQNSLRQIPVDAVPGILDVYDVVIRQY